MTKAHQEVLLWVHLASDHVYSARSLPSIYSNKERSEKAELCSSSEGKELTKNRKNKHLKNVLGMMELKQILRISLEPFQPLW